MSPAVRLPRIRWPLPGSAIEDMAAEKFSESKPPLFPGSGPGVIHGLLNACSKLLPREIFNAG